MPPKLPGSFRARYVQRITSKTFTNHLHTASSARTRAARSEDHETIMRHLSFIQGAISFRSVRSLHCACA